MVRYARVLALPADAAKVADLAGPFESGLDTAMVPLPMHLGGSGLSTLLEDVAHSTFVSAAGRD